MSYSVTDLPDYQTPISISAVEIDSVPIDIVAQTLGAVSVNITNVPVEVTNPAGENLNVAIQSSIALDVNVTNASIAVTNPVGESLNVAVTSSVDLNANIINTPLTITNPMGENLNVAIQSSIALDVNVTNTSIAVTNVTGENLNVAIQSSVPLDVNIANMPIEVTNPTGQNLNVAIQSSIALDVNVTNTPLTITNPTGENLNVAIQQSTVTLDVNVTNTPIEITNPTGENLNVAVQSSIPLDVNVTNTPLTITNPTGENLNVAVQSSIDLNVNVTNTPIEITNPTGENLNVAIQSSITLNVNISNVSAGVTFDVNISNVEAGVTFNIKTESGANIVIDKLTQDAYTQRRVDYINNGATATMTAITNTTYRGKWFPRGCRGYIDNVQVYCDNPDTTDHTITVYLTPHMGMAPIYSATITVPAGSGASWRFAYFRLMWNYDSMFVYVIADNANYPRIGYDTGTPVDAYYSTDGATWYFEDRRYWIKLGFVGLTVGDLPVSGTVNTIEVPTSTTGYASGLISVNVGETKTLLTINEPGEVIHIWCDAGSPNMRYRFTVDGEDLWFGVYDYLSTEYLNGRGFTASTPGISLTQYNSAEPSVNAFTITIPIRWRRSLQIRVTNSGSSTQNAAVTVNYNRLFG